MSYQVLARKWRPKNFEQLVGQEHVVTVLVNALSQQRLHHAYLFTGTRGVGKTTIARIFAKSLNCEQGISATPCGVCDTCVDIDQGRFVDLLEIDAASRTKVDDTREILDNVQYAPSRGRYKVYLIDEVHMLSRSSFNALLKTLEEPPEHVKFILATTDPQKLPVTVLSRCLQFHLKALTVTQIESKLEQILQDEQVTHEAGTLTLLAKAARGSMRDSLSLTDQAIAQGQGALNIANIQQMLGGIDQNWPFKILIHLVKQDAQALMQLSQEIASFAPSYSRLLAELIQLLHQVALAQVVQHHFDLSPEHEILLQKLCQAMSPEDVQLYYQIALNGRKDLPYACDEQAAFDMVLLRLLAFKPMAQVDANTSDTAQQTTQVSFDDVELKASNVNTSSIKAAPTEAVHADEIKPVEQTSIQPMPAQPSNENADATVNQTLDDLDAQLRDVEQLAQQHGHVMPNAENTPLAEPQVEQAIEQPHAAGLEDDMFANAPVQEPMSAANAELAPELENNHHQPTEFENNAIAQPEHQAQQVQAKENPVQPIAQQQANSAASYKSPIEAALATRNMLRSRKKQLEKDSKKSSGVSGRQTQQDAPLADETATQDNKPQVPDINTIPEQPFSPEIIDPTVIRSANQVDKWANMIDAMSLIARVRQLALHATIDESSTDDILRLKLDQSIKHLNSDAAHKQLEASLSEYLGRSILVELEIVEKTVADPYQIQAHINDKRLDYAKELIKSDPVVVQLVEQFQAQIDEDSIQPL
ncbi:DNA polymerase III subunit gamma/tau [Thalassotalea sp. PLHSN55]|uniref:DNA polymerase III subunit gamma/tau n=1 Tax=Thalassotalea sp. PLHSN55 TaxID=3435888 RepID=UPI003F835A4C